MIFLGVAVNVTYTLSQCLKQCPSFLGHGGIFAVKILFFAFATVALAKV